MSRDSAARHRTESPWSSADTRKVMRLRRMNVWTYRVRALKDLANASRGNTLMSPDQWSFAWRATRIQPLLSFVRGPARERESGSKYSAYGAIDVGVTRRRVITLASRDSLTAHASELLDLVLPCPRPTLGAQGTGKVDTIARLARLIQAVPRNAPVSREIHQKTQSFRLTCTCCSVVTSFSVQAVTGKSRNQVLNRKNSHEFFVGRDSGCSPGMPSKWTTSLHTNIFGPGALGGHIADDDPAYAARGGEPRTLWRRLAT